MRSIIYPKAKKLLPKFAHGLTEQVSELDLDAVKVKTLRSAVKDELKSYRAGENPLEPKQVDALYNFLLNTRDF